MRKQREDVYERSEEICDLYEQGIGMNKISQRFGCSRTIIKSILKSNNIEIRSRIDSVRKKRRPDVYERSEEICDLYKEGISMYKISQRFACTPEIIKSILKSNNIETASHIDSIKKKRRPDVWKRSKEVCDLYQDGHTIPGIAAIMDCASGTGPILEILKVHNIERRPPGPQPPRWRYE